MHEHIWINPGRGWKSLQETSRSIFWRISRPTLKSGLKLSINMAPNEKLYIWSPMELLIYGPKLSCPYVYIYIYKYTRFQMELSLSFSLYIYLYIIVLSMYGRKAMDLSIGVHRTQSKNEFKWPEVRKVFIIATGE